VPRAAAEESSRQAGEATVRKGSINAVGAGDDLLRDGIARFLPRASYEIATPGYARITHRLRPRRLRLPPEELLRRHLKKHGAREPDPNGAPAPIVLFDIESLGFVGRPLFLIGALRATPRDAGEACQLDAVQYLARDYAEEAAVVSAFQSETPGTGLWVSFNGLAFDLPALRLRAAHHRLPWEDPSSHLDLLHLARRLWGKRLPNCKLKTLERAICRRPRGDGDIDSGQIPAAYHAFVRTGEPLDVLDILQHNLSDLTGLFEILLRALAELRERVQLPR
jgi:uncharacterized protein YprB with RNaseH-like and TPR domain